jgi:hypothetical protein
VGVGHAFAPMRVGKWPEGQAQLGHER